MSQENVEAFKRAVDAGNRGDVEAGLLKELDPEVEWHPVLLTSLEAEATVYRGHDGVREWFRTMSETFSERHIDVDEVRDLGDRLIAIGRARMRGEASGAVTESPIAYLVDFSNAKATRVQSYLDPQEALEASGLSE
jgi:ketosteroid isomerase-like protein